MCGSLSGSVHVDVGQPHDKGSGDMTVGGRMCLRWTLRDFQRLVLEKAKEAGFSDLRRYIYRKDESFQAAVSGGEIEHYETSATAGASYQGE